MPGARLIRAEGIAVAFEAPGSYAASLNQNNHTIEVGTATVQLEASASNEVHLLPILSELPETVQHQLWLTVENGEARLVARFRFDGDEPLPQSCDTILVALSQQSQVGNAAEVDGNPGAAIMRHLYTTLPKPVLPTAAASTAPVAAAVNMFAKKDVASCIVKHLTAEECINMSSTCSTLREQYQQHTLSLGVKLPAYPHQMEELLWMADRELQGKATAIRHHQQLFYHCIKTTAGRELFVHRVHRTVHMNRIPEDSPAHVSGGLLCAAPGESSHFQCSIFSPCLLLLSWSDMHDNAHMHNFAPCLCDLLQAWARPTQQ
jgi:hypothetical protein